MLFGLLHVMAQVGFVSWSHVSTSAQKYWSSARARGEEEKIDSGAARNG